MKTYKKYRGYSDHIGSEVPTYIYKITIIRSFQIFTFFSSFILLNSESLAQPESDAISNHSIRYFEYGIGFFLALVTLVFLLGFFLFMFFSSVVIIRIMYPVEHIKKILLGHCK